MIFTLIAAVGVIGSGDPKSCDPMTYQSRVDTLEDRAFASLKAANEAVALAARTGAVGTAGDSQWAAYKDLRAQAEAQRLAAAKALATCQSEAAPITQIAANPTVPPDPPETRRIFPSTAANDHHFTLGLTFGAGVFGVRSPTSIAAVNETGTFTTAPTLVEQIFPYASTAPPPPTAPTITVPPPSGTFAAATAARTVLPLASRSWSDNQSLSLIFTPSGLAASGWRFGASFSREAFESKQYLSRPLVGTFQLGATTSSATLIGCFPGPLGGPPYYATTECQYSVNASAPYANTYYALGALNSTVGSISRYEIDQKTKTLKLAMSVAHQSIMDTPIGALKIEPGMDAGVTWRQLRQADILAFAPNPQLQTDVAPVSPLVATENVTGPSVRIDADLSIKGRLPMRFPPLGWEISGAIGYERVSLTGITSQQTFSFSRGKFVSMLGGGLNYSITHDLHVNFDVEWVRDFYIATLPPNNDAVTASTTPGNLVSLSGKLLSNGDTISLRRASGVLYEFGLRYDFW